MVIAEGGTNGSLRRFCSAVLENNLLPELKRPIFVDFKQQPEGTRKPYNWEFCVDENYDYLTAEVYILAGAAILPPIGFEHAFTFSRVKG